MKKCFGATHGFDMDGLRNRIVVLKEKDNKKMLFAAIALVTAVLVAVTAGVVYLLKTKMDDEYEEDWDYDWDDEDECDCGCADEEVCEEDCCCTDKDVDHSVKVEQA